MPRAILILTTFFSLALGLNWLCYVGTKTYDVPVQGVRRFIQKYFALKLPSYFITLFMGYRMVKIDYADDDQVDWYSKYLGPNWRQNKFTG